MYYLSRYCFICFNNGSPLYKVIQKDKRNDIAKEMEYVLPELVNIKTEIPLYVCSICQNTVDLFYTFKKMCIENYFRFKQYTYILQGACDARKHKYKELQIRVQSKKVDNILKRRRAKKSAAEKKTQNSKQVSSQAQNDENYEINCPEEIREKLQRIKEEMEEEECADHNYAVCNNNKKYSEIEQIHCINCKKWYKIFTLENNTENQFTIKEFYCLDCNKKLINNYNLTEDSTQTKIIEESDIKKEIENEHENNKNVEQENENNKVKEEILEEQVSIENITNENEINGEKTDKNDEDYEYNEDEEYNDEKRKSVSKKKRNNKRKNCAENVENIMNLLPTIKKRKYVRKADKNKTVGEIKDLSKTSEKLNKSTKLINDKLELETKKKQINSEDNNDIEKNKKTTDDTSNILDNSDVFEYIRAEGKQFKCLLCNQMFSKKSYAVVHLKNHLKIKEFKCLKCDKFFALKHNLNVHMQSHAFCCNLCNIYIGKNLIQPHRCVEKKSKTSGLTPISCKKY